jgi:hypothetical protein
MGDKDSPRLWTLPKLSAEKEAIWLKVDPEYLTPRLQENLWLGVSMAPYHKLRGGYGRPWLYRELQARGIHVGA